ncbi:hypothetical protein CB0940_04253 [Cercospora beticola]|uniref:Uncharacterized protein n=1 Tax=Cercospora beticola TaxID=122368 RepID=A0A2G5HLV0_CERBT|nr:hypothetical protein CB0940_04253 [Cercospora beticola]PIA93505.1 hypothetical protein CB0940_04253 [Cercospora beticola]WPB01476.1 hypothetical protein RHO25_006102 [Cercospora beticola]
MNSSTPRDGSGKHGGGGGHGNSGEDSRRRTTLDGERLPFRSRWDVSGREKGTSSGGNRVDLAAAHPFYHVHHERAPRNEPRQEGLGPQEEEHEFAFPGWRSNIFVHRQRTAEEEKQPLPDGLVADYDGSTYSPALNTRTIQGTKPDSPAPRYHRYPYEAHQALAYDRSDANEIHGRYVLGSTSRGWLTTQQK